MYVALTSPFNGTLSFAGSPAVACMQPSKAKSYLLVAVQFVCLILILITGPILARNPLLLLGELAAVALAGWAIVTVRVDRVNVLPEVRQGADLVRTGPYRIIRHPMYASLLLGALALVADAPSLLRWVLWIVLLADLLVKLHYEEEMLAAHFADYAAYQSSSRRLIPFVY